MVYTTLLVISTGLSYISKGDSEKAFQQLLSGGLGLGRAKDLLLRHGGSLCHADVLAFEEGVQVMNEVISAG